MNAPIREFVERYAAGGASRLHMPGHKGVGPLGCEAFDITEIAGADALYEAEGIIAESEANATAIFETRRTLYSTEGSSQCIRAMLHLALTVWAEDAAKRTPNAPASAAHDSTHNTPAGAAHNLPAGAGRNVPAGAGRNLPAGAARRRPVALAGRNAHRAFLTAAALDDFDVEWLWPEAESSSPCACPITAEGLARALDAMAQAPFCVYVTSPDYPGGMLDIEALSAVCHARGIPLLVDNAHGAHLKFLPERAHPMELGADMCCDSAHKTLRALTGAAYLHIGKGADSRYAENAKRAMALFGSTSPSYLILQSLDCLNLELAGDFPARLADCRARVDELKVRLAARGFEPLPSDPLKLTLRTDGFRAAELLRAGGVEPELAERERLVLMFSPANSPEDWARVARALAAPPPFSPAPAIDFPAPPRAMSVRAAMFAPCESVPVARAVGRICASPSASCPPAIAIAAPGERVTEALARALRLCGIRALTVVRKD